MKTNIFITSLFGFWVFMNLCFIKFLDASEKSTIVDSNELQSPNSPKKALIFGITGQDGSYLAELLLEKGYEVHGALRRASTADTTNRITHLLHNRRLKLHIADVTDGLNVSRLVKSLKPDEIYNLAAQSHVRISFDIPEYTMSAVAMGVINILESIRCADLISKTRYYQASSSEMYGKVHKIPQSESTPFHPRSPYAVAKLCGFWATVNYREAYGMFAANGILFNHESPRRGEDFVTRKITKGLARIKLGKQEMLYLGNLDAKRDWGYAKDYVEAMWLMLQQNTPQDYVIAMGETRSVREFIEIACKEIGIELKWQGNGLEEKGFDAKTGKPIIAIDPDFFRPAEVDLLIGNPKKAELELGWKPKTSFQELVKLMIEEDLKNESKSK